MNSHNNQQPPLPNEPQVNAGVYCLLLNLPSQVSVTIGKLGTFTFASGVYCYCGSAQRNLQARIQRHRRHKKKLHWHIDYFRLHCQYLGEAVYPLEKEGECWLVKELLKLPSSYLPVRKFGSSDCTCRSHFVHVPNTSAHDLLKYLTSLADCY